MQVGLAWGEGGGWLSGGCQPAEGHVALVLSVERVGVDARRQPEGEGSFGLVVYAGTFMSPTAVLAQCRPLLSDEECAEVARALGY